MTALPASSALPGAHKAVAAGSHLTEAQALMDNIITLMGISFILGVLFTTFLLLVLEFIRRQADEQD